MKRFVNTYEAKTRLSELINEVQLTGETIVICRNGKPLADLVSHKSIVDPLKQNPRLKGARFHGDPCAPVNEEDWPEEFR